MIRLSLFFASMLLFCLALAFAPVTTPPECGPDATAAMEFRLYFGRNSGNVETVSDEAWQSFLSEEITPRFPDGLTVLDGAGQWRNGGEPLVRERTKVVILLTSDTPESHNATEDVARAYNEAFSQEAVLRTQTATCLSIIAPE